jgi:hypothetical protein
LPPLPPESHSDLEIDLVVSRPTPENVRLDKEFDLSILLAVRAFKLEVGSADRPFKFAVQCTRPPPPTSNVANQAELTSILSASPTTSPFQRSLSKMESDSPSQETPKELPPKPPHPIVLPPPYDPDLPASINGARIDSIGPSAFLLPLVQLQKQYHAINNSEYYQGEVTFSLRFSASHSGYGTIGGLRLFLIRDLIVPEEQEALLLKKWPVISEVWVDP